MSELTGAELDKAVAEATGNTHYLDLGEAWHPSTNWAQGGPLVEDHKITIDYMDGDEWEAIAHNPWAVSVGPTPLIAACRAIVASKEEV